MFASFAAKLDALNPEQQAAAKAVLASVSSWCTNQDLAGGYIPPSKASVFFIEGPAGTGKTTTYKAICEMLEAKGKSVLCMAFTGSAACLLPNGRTCHNALKLPVPLNEDSVSGLEVQFEQ